MNTKVQKIRRETIEKWQKLRENETTGRRKEQIIPKVEDRYWEIKVFNQTSTWRRHIWLIPKILTLSLEIFKITDKDVRMYRRGSRMIFFTFFLQVGGHTCPLCPRGSITVVCIECGEAEDPADIVLKECSEINSTLGKNIIMEKRERKALVTRNTEHFNALHECRNTVHNYY